MAVGVEDESRGDGLSAQAVGRFGRAGEQLWGETLHPSRGAVFGEPLRSEAAFEEQEAVDLDGVGEDGPADGFAGLLAGAGDDDGAVVWRQAGGEPAGIEHEDIADSVADSAGIVDVDARGAAREAVEEAQLLKGLDDAALETGERAVEPLLEGEEVVGAAGMVLDVGGEEHDAAKIVRRGRPLVANL